MKQVLCSHHKPSILLLDTNYLLDKLQNPTNPMRARSGAGVATPGGNVDMTVVCRVFFLFFFSFVEKHGKFM